MTFPRRLIDGYGAFARGRLQSEQDRYRGLAEHGQTPEIMVIGCCDSRVSPEVIFDARPGELFVVRNVANLVPPFETGGTYHGVSAAGATSDIQRPMKSPGDNGSASSANALMPPQWAWPSTTMCLTFSAATPNSSAADTP